MHRNKLVVGVTVRGIVSSAYLCYYYVAVAERRDTDGNETISQCHAWHQGPEQRPCLDIQPEVVYILDTIVVTFVYIEKLHMPVDKERAAQRNSWGEPQKVGCSAVYRAGASNGRAKGR